MMDKPVYKVLNSKKTKKYFIKNKIENPTLVITSPPYFDIKNYENIENQLGLNQDYQTYLKEIADILHQCYDISENNATLWLVVDTIKKNGKILTIPFDICNALSEYQTKTWILKDIIIWNKLKNLPWHSKGRLKNKFEYILFFTKNDNYKYYIDNIREIKDYKKWWKTYPERYNPKGKPPSNIWEFKIPIRGWGNGYQKHLCPLPFPLIERIISLSSDENELIFDPFAGSGSVLALAHEMNRKAYGFDINENYKKKFYSEVMKGAKVYWEKRKSGLKKLIGERKKFSLLNTQLRKIKTSLKLMSQIKTQVNNKSYYFSIDSGDDCVNMFIISRKNTNIKYNFNDYIRALKKEFKIDVNLKFDTIDNFSNNSYRKYYLYNDKKIYQFEKEIQFDMIFNSKKKLYNDFLFSNIKSELEIIGN